MSTPNERQLALVERFADIDDWEERYRQIIKLGRDLEGLPDELKSDKLKVQGCQSQVWLHAELAEGGLVRFRADSDAMIVRGLIAMLLDVYSGAAPAEILATEPTFVGEIGLESHLSPTRTNGLRAMLEQMLYYAKAFETLLKVRGGN
jgi:cysteine desulfuration protein SufE